MTITFLGTRGNINIRSKLHYRHTATLITYYKKRIMIDCGHDWRTKIFTINPDALFITHGHPDHAAGLKNGSPCPVYATQESWNSMKHYAIADKIIITPKETITIGTIKVQALRVVHSINAPAVGYRITAGNTTIFYVPDVVDIKDKKAALSDIDLYCGDGAIVTRSLLVRKRGTTLIGHAPITAQLDWCKKTGVQRAIFTHCGTEITSADQKKMRATIKALGKERGIDADLAYDGFELQVTKKV